MKKVDSAFALMKANYIIILDYILCFNMLCKITTDQLT